MSTIIALIQAHTVITTLCVVYFISPLAVAVLQWVEARLDTTKLSALADILRGMTLDAPTITRGILALFGIAPPAPASLARKLAYKASKKEGSP